jgi:aerobic-type carbon monoxide dehydrogenase small subunit (CoxS/CutS family)
MKGFRIEAGVDRGQQFQFLCNGEPLFAYPGESIAAALLLAGRRVLRATRQGQGSGLYCGMGVCWECAVTVDGKPGVRACMTLATPGAKVETATRREQCK